MMGRRLLRRFGRDEHGASAAEFALVLPLFLLFLLGTIDVGLYAWTINQQEKATQMGARWAAATDMVPSGLINHSFAVSEAVPQGSVVPLANFPGVTCDNTGCTCKAGGTCSFAVAPGTQGSAAFTAIVTRMQDFRSSITPEKVVIDYDWSGLGYSGDPTGPDVAPFVTVRLRNMTYQPITLLLFGGEVGLPETPYTITSEDAQGTFSN